MATVKERCDKWARVHGPAMRNGPQSRPAVLLIGLSVMYIKTTVWGGRRVPKLVIGCAQGDPGQVVHAHHGGLDGHLKEAAHSLQQWTD
jgi:hypothetical protein